MHCSSGYCTFQAVFSLGYSLVDRAIQSANFQNTPMSCRTSLFLNVNTALNGMIH